MSYEYVASYFSRSQPDKQYTVKMNELGEYGCDCPSWRFSPKRLGPGKRGCRHTDMAAAAGLAPMGATRAPIVSSVALPAVRRVEALPPTTRRFTPPPTTGGGRFIRIFEVDE